MKVLINTSMYGLNLSTKAKIWLIDHDFNELITVENGNYILDEYNMCRRRHDPLLIQCFEDSQANGWNFGYSDLHKNEYKIVEIPDDVEYEIEYEGNLDYNEEYEIIVEKHRTWGRE